MKHKFFKFLTPILLFVGLGIAPNAWASNGFVKATMWYNVNNENKSYDYNKNNGDIDLGLLTTDFKLTGLTFEVWDDWSSGSAYTQAALYWDGGGEYKAQNKIGKASNSNNYQFKAQDCNFVIIKHDEGNSGTFTKEYWMHVWGPESYSGNDWIKNGENNCKWTYKIKAPAVTSFTVTKASTAPDVVSGEGTSSNPYIIKYNGSLPLSASCSKAREDANSDRNYKFGSGTYSTTSTYNGLTNITANSSITVNARCINSDASLNGDESSYTVYYQVEPSYTITISSADASRGTVDKDSYTAYQYYSNTATIAATPKSDSYQFTSWTLSDGVTPAQGYTINSATIRLMATKTGTAIANFSKIKGAVNFGAPDDNGSLEAVVKGGSSISSGDEINSTSLINFTATPNTGYEVEGWYSDASFNTPIQGAGTGTSLNDQTVGDELNVYVKFKETDYTITLTKGTGIDAIKVDGATQTFVMAHVATKTATITADVATGYTWKEWTVSTNNITADPNLNTNGIQINATSTGTLTATATPKTYTVSFNQNGGTGGSTNVTATYNAAMPSATMPTKLGYKFLGYYDEETDGTQYYNADGTSAKEWDKDQNNVTLYAHWVKMYFFIEGRFHVANAERTPHGAVWTNTFTNEGWTDESRTIPMVWNATENRYEVHTFATPKELSTDLGTQDQKTPWFYIKASESATEWTNPIAYYSATEEGRKLTTANKKATIGTEQKYFYFDPETTTTDKWTILCYDAEGVYFVLEDIPPYYSINVSVAEGDENKGTVKPTVMNEINTLAYGTAKAESKDPQLYSFEKWGWTSNTQKTESFDFTSEITLHDSCQNTWPEIRVNAAGTDLMLIAHFKAREIVTIYFVDSENWGTNIRMHLWGGFEQGTTWPGIKPNETDLTCNGHKVYSYTFDKGAYEKVKWSKNGDDKSSNFIIDPELPYYNEHDGRWYDALSSIGPDKTICAQWRVVFNNSDEYFKLVEGQTNVYECFLANVPAWEKEGDNWVKMKYKSGDVWDWRGFTVDDQNHKVESYPRTFTSSENSDIQNQLNLAGIAEGQTQDFVLTFNTTNLQLNISRPTPKVEIGVKNQAGTAITEFDIDSEEGFVLNAYPQNVDKGTECSYSFQYQKDGGSWTTISGATTKSSTIMGSQLNGPGVYKFKVIMTTGGQPYTSTESGNITIYKYYWLAIKDNKNDGETTHWASYLYCWGTSGIKLAWPGESISNPTTGDLKTRDGWIYFRLKYPNYDKVLLTNGKSDKDEVKTNDIEINPSAALCYKITDGSSWDEYKQKSIWPTSTADCPSRLFVDNDKYNYEMTKDGSIEINPTIIYYGTNKLEYSWSAADDNIVVASNGASAVVSPKAGAAAKQTDLTFHVTDNDGQTAEYVFHITVTNKIRIRIWNRYDKTTTDSGWWLPTIYAWKDSWNITVNMISEGNQWYYYDIDKDNFNFVIWRSSSDNIKENRTQNIEGVTASGCWSVSSDNDGYGNKKLEKVENCEMYFRVKSVMSDGKTAYYSNKVTAAGSQISFYADKVGTLILQRYDESKKEFEDVKTLTLASSLEESYVYVATFTGNDITGMTKYTGDYYIRTDGAKGGWNDYKQAGNKFTSFTRNPLFGNEKYNYYWVTTLKNGENAKAEVGNEINKCLAQTIDDYSCDKNVAANVRFGYCPETNYFTRAIIAGSTADANYLTLYGDNSTYFNGGDDNSTLYTDEQLTHKIYDDSPLAFKDLSDWVYEAEVYAAVDVTRPSDTKAVIKSHYNTLTDYLLGYDSENQRPSYAYTVLGNTSTKNMTFKITVTYDYKMNRLTTAWKPLAGEIDGHLSVDAAIMFVNPVDKDDDVQQITVKDKDSDISSLNNIVYVMEFEETENIKDHTKETNHWISLPFDCRISDIYGIEGYVTLDNNKMPTDGVWGIQRYDGEGRASKGRMTQSDTYWTWMSRDEELKAGEGYVLSFDRGAIDWPEIEGTRIKRLYFQSKTAGFTLNLSGEEAIQEVAEHVENASLHRYGEDANWNLIGPLAYNNITIKEWTGKEDAPKFLYEYLGKNTTYIEGIGKYRLVNPLDNKGGDTQFKFHSFHSYMVQFAGDINWAQYTQTQQDNPATAPLMATADAEFTYTQMRLNLIKENQLMDKTYVCLSATGTTGYDLNDDLSKITEAKANQLGSSVDGRIYAANTLPLETEMVALYVNIASAGEYTIALSQENPYLQVSLIDAQTGMTTVLENASYTITLNKGEYKDRFYLQLKQKSGETPTSFEGKIEQFNLPTDKTQKLLINGNIYLINGGRVYNATGAELR